MDADAALIASTSYSTSGFSAITVMTTWTSLRRPALKVGRSGRSISRQVRMASSDGRPSRRKNEPGMRPGGVHPLLDVDGEREEVELLLRVLAGRGGAQQHGVLVEERGDGAGGLLGQPTGLEADGAGAEAAVVDDGGRAGGGGIGHVSPRLPAGLAGPEPRSVRASPDRRVRRAGLRSKPPEHARVALRTFRWPLPRTGRDRCAEPAGLDACSRQWLTVCSVVPCRLGRAGRLVGAAASLPRRRGRAVDGTLP